MEDYSLRINFTPELWVAAASKLREKYAKQIEQIREASENYAIDIPRIALELELARRLKDNDLERECEAEMRIGQAQSMARMEQLMFCQLRIAELDKLMSEDGARTQAVNTYMERYTQISKDLNWGVE